MITIEKIKDYWEFYEFKTNEKRAEKIIELTNNLTKEAESKLKELNIISNGYFYISPHSLIRLIQSDIDILTIQNSFHFVLKSHLITLKSGKPPINKFIGNLKVLKAAMNRIEMKNKNIFIVYRTRPEEKYLNRLDIISIGIPGVRPRNSKKIKNWENMSNEEKKDYFLKKNVCTKL